MLGPTQNRKLSAVRLNVRSADSSSLYASGLWETVKFGQLGAMNELISQLVAKADLTPDQAAKVADVVKGFLADKLPEPIKGAVLGAISAQSVDSAADKAKSLLGGLAGKMF